jgi:hypothetical protein
MKRRIISIATALLAAILLTSTVFAGAIKFSNVTFSLGSLISNGDLTGLGNQDVEVILSAIGVPAITCTNYGGNQVPGQSYPKVSASGTQTLHDDDQRSKNGKSPFYVETDEPQTLTWDEAGCPNSNWSASIDFVFWTEATINVYEVVNGENTGVLLASQDYTCVTTRDPDTVSCTPVK